MLFLSSVCMNGGAGGQLVQLQSLEEHDLINAVLLYSTIRCQFHQHFTSSFICTKVLCAAFQTWNLCLPIFFTEKGNFGNWSLVKKLLTKCWWTWLQFASSRILVDWRIHQSSQFGLNFFIVCEIVRQISLTSVFETFLSRGILTSYFSHDVSKKPTNCSI